MFRSLAFLFACFCASGSAISKELIKLTAGADPWPPYIDENHPKGGVSVEIADAAFRTQGYTVTNQILPWARAIEETKQGRLDLILDAWLNEERSKVFKFSRPYLNGPIKFIKRKETDFEFNDLSSLEGKSLALVRDYAYGDELLNSTSYEKVSVNHFMQGIQMLARGRVDLSIENELVALTRIKREAPKVLKLIDLVDPPLSDAFVYVIDGFKNPDHEKLISAFDRGLSVILENGVYQEIMERNGLPVPLFLKQ